MGKCKIEHKEKIFSLEEISRKIMSKSICDELRLNPKYKLEICGINMKKCLSKSGKASECEYHEKTYGDLYNFPSSETSR